MIDLETAQQLLWQAVEPLEATEIELSVAHGRVLMQQVVSDRDAPPTDRSAMDGFALRTVDHVEGLREFEIAGEVRAGEPAGLLRIGPGQAVRIMTGAVVPDGADAVVMVEHTESNASRDRVRVDGPVEAGQHIRPRGQDRRRGQPVLEPGGPIHAPEIATLATVGATRILVARTPDVRVLATGDELVEPDQPVLPHQLRNSNSHALVAQLGELGIAGDDLGIAEDDRTGLKRRIERGLEGNCLLITGGVSAGEYDLVHDVLAECGLELLFHRVSVKPGKPILAGRCRGCLVIGLPGNPVSTFAGFAVFVAPALRKMMGYRHWTNVELSAALEEPLQVKPGRPTFHLARVREDSGGLKARRVDSSGSGDVLSLHRANAFMHTSDAGAGFRVGDPVQVMLWRDFHLR